MNRALFTALIIALLSAAPASAQLMGARELTTTAIAKGASATKPVPDFYYLAGESGAKETYVLTIKGPAMLSLFTPDGHEMVSATGSGKVTLIAYLNLNDVFTLAVSRATPAQPYTLSRQASVPTLTEAGTFAEVGFTTKSATGVESTRCWITPGVKNRTTTSKQTVEVTLAADRTTLNGVVHEGDASRSFEVTRSLVGNTLTTKLRWSDGEKRENSFELPRHSSDDGTIRAFSGYLCHD